ncbi:MAG: YkgJ family cysteine cluster protein [Bacillota bacterium]|nr:YkgJ family cysteine cluster protein [Bacillota bacterium]
MIGRVSVTTVVIKGVNGYGVRVSDPAATVQDYLDVVNEAIERGRLFRGRAERADCLGCDLCCQERIPLTSIDVLRLYSPLVPEPLTAFIRKHAHISVDGGAVDITLRRDRQGRCLFLRPGEGTCRIYDLRPLVCQTFICCPQTKRARRLREQIVNVGEDELVRQWLMENQRLNTTPHIDETSGRHRVRLDDWPLTPFSGKKAYDEVLLRSVCSPVVWGDIIA